MNVLDWMIVIFPLTFVLGMAFYSKRYVRGVADFLAAGRVAGRYVISVGDLTAGLSVITLVSGCEIRYQTGFGIAFWNQVLLPVGIVLALTGYCTYRWRETRCLSRGQFIELRYGSKFFRVVTAVISTVSEMITNAIGPAVAANFFIYYLGLPHKIMICGVGLPCYAIIVFLCLTLALLLIWPAGRISLLLTDCIQGLISYPIFVIIVGFIVLKFSWNVDIIPLLWDRVPQQSFISPYDVAQLRDFNVFALVVTLTSTILNRASWIGNDTTNSGRSPHEQKMAGVLGAFRTGFSSMMTILIAIVLIVFMNSGHFAEKTSRNHFHVTNNEIRQEVATRVLEEAVEDPGTRKEVATRIGKIPAQVHRTGVDEPYSQEKNLDTVYYDVVKDSLGDSPQGSYEFQKFRSLFHQMLIPTTLKSILPAGLLGLFCLLMIMLLISTDDSRIFNAAGCLVQDVILPFFKGHLSTRKHLLILRLTSLAVTVFFLIVALFFSQLDYINMFVTIMCAFWLGGAGPIMIGGLYTRFGNLTGAWCSIIFGSGTSLLGLIAQRNWAMTIYPWLESHGLVNSMDRILRGASSPFEPWIHWQMDPAKFPINSYEIFFISMVLAISGYIVGSYLTYKPYNLEKLLHRGKYSDGVELRKESWTLRNLFSKLIGITPEYSRGDKFISYMIFLYSFGYQFVFSFLLVVIWNAISPWPKSWWNAYFYTTTIAVPAAIGCITTVWFTIGGIMDAKRLFVDLANRTEDPNDNGQVFKE